LPSFCPTFVLLLSYFCPLFVPPPFYICPSETNTFVLRLSLDFVLLLSLRFVLLLSHLFCPTFVLLLTLFVLSLRTKVGQKVSTYQNYFVLILSFQNILHLSHVNFVPILSLCFVLFLSYFCPTFVPMLNFLSYFCPFICYEIFKICLFCPYFVLLLSLILLKISTSDRPLRILYGCVKRSN
jgi:hypothetical protein